MVSGGLSEKVKYLSVRISQTEWAVFGKLTWIISGREK